MGEEYESALPGLEAFARQALKGEPVSLDLPMAEQLLEQFLETASYRAWTLESASILFNHAHLVVEAPPEIGKELLLRDFKSYGARRLNKHFGRRESDKWWTKSGSCRPIKHLPSANFYVCHRQPNPLVVWSRIRGRIPPLESDPDNTFAEYLEKFCALD